MPRFEGATEWFNGTQAHAEAEVQQHPTLVHFGQSVAESAKTTCRVLHNGATKKERWVCA